MGNYYLLNSDDYYFNSSTWAENRLDLLEENAKLLSLNEANKLCLEKFCTKSDIDAKPNLSKDFQYLTIPYELDDIIYDNITPTEIIVKLVNHHIQGKIILESTDRDSCCVVECEELSEMIIECLYMPHLNTPFFIFNPDESVFALIDFDLPLQIIGYSQDLNVKIDNYKSIQLGFESVFQRYASYTNMGNLFKEYYAFLLPKPFVNNLIN